jgi:hypothetical protein
LSTIWTCWPEGVTGTGSFSWQQPAAPPTWQKPVPAGNDEHELPPSLVPPALQVPPPAYRNVPFDWQVNCADPVLVPDAVTEICAPVDAEALIPVHRRELTTHSSDCPAAHVVLELEHVPPDTLTVPFEHEAVADPVSGVVESVTVALLPDAPPE